MKVISAGFMLGLAFLAGATARVRADSAATQLGVGGSQFTVNGQPVFLVGVSYYGGLGASEEFIKRDLDDIERHGFRSIRVFATWRSSGTDVSAVNADGDARAPYLAKLAWLVGECDRRGLIVDVTMSRGSPGVSSLAAHRRAARTLVAALRPRGNWYLDLANEHDVDDARFVSIAELAELRALVKTLDPGRLVTASSGGDISRDSLRELLETVKVDFVCPHRPRTPDSPRQTEAKTREYLAWMKEIGRVVPVHYQEPFRRNYGRWEPTADDFVTDLRGARSGGAAGWCFHNGDPKGAPTRQPRRSFDLRERRLFDQFDDVDRQTLQALRRPAG